MARTKRSSDLVDTGSVDDYLRLPYTVEVIRDESDGLPGYVARVVELRGCLTQAGDFQELGEMVEDAMRVWIETALEDGRVIPPPRLTAQHSGKFLVRVPRSLHRQLADAADRDGVSLNNLVNVILARAMGERTGTVSSPQPAPAWEYPLAAAHYLQVAESKDAAS
jgi:antitoxin HicB